MSIPTYSLGYPPDGSSLGETKAVIRNNLDGTFLTLGIDHVNNNGQPGSNPAGYHTVIHQVTQTADPPAISGVNQVYSKLVTPNTSGGVADTQLFTRTGNGGISQLTGSSSVSDGWQWVGGVLLQWGTVLISTGTGDSSHRTGTLTFQNRNAGAIPFPNNCFNITANLTVINTTDTTSSSTISFRSISATSFRWLINMSTSNLTTTYPSFYWFAVGN
jgi:hypothetical protein